MSLLAEYFEMQDQRRAILNQRIRDELPFQGYGLFGSLAIGTGITMMAYHFGLQDAGAQLLLLSTPPIAKTADFIIVLSYPMTKAKAAQTSFAKMCASALVPGAQVVPRLVDRHRKTDNYRPRWCNGPKA